MLQPMTETLPGWATVNDAAAITGYNEQYVRKLARDGRITAVKVGGGGIYLVEMASLERWIAEHGTDRAADDADER